MEDLRAKMQEDLKAAMKNKNNHRRDVLRLVQSAMKQVEVDSQKELSPEDILAILQKEAKRRRESIADYTSGGRDDLAQAEQAELAIIEEFLPRQLSAEEVGAIVDEVIAQTGATSAKEMGKVMGPVMAKVRGLADGALVNQIVREKLNA